VLSYKEDQTESYILHTILLFLSHRFLLNYKNALIQLAKKNNFMLSGQRFVKPQQSRLKKIF